jgi:hypothetical protein
MWADGIAYTLGREGESTDPVAAATAYFQVADAYGSSPFASLAMAQVIRMENDGIPDDVRIRAARRIIADYPRELVVDTAAALLYEKHPAQVPADEMAGAAGVAALGGDPARRPLWRMIEAQLRADQHRDADALAAAKDARASGKALQEELRVRGVDVDGNLIRFKPQIDAAVGAAEALIQKLETR